MKLYKLFFNFADVIPDQDEGRDDKIENVKNNKSEPKEVYQRKVPKHQKRPLTEKNPSTTELEIISNKTEPSTSEFSSDAFTVNFKRRNTIPLTKGSFVRYKHN